MLSNEYDKILKLTEDDTVELANGFKDLLHKKLCLGQSRYLCRYGTLGEGHEHITDTQRYFQSIREMYCLSGSIRSYRASAMLAQADLLDAQEQRQKATKKSEELRADAKIMQAQEQLITALVTVEDQLRMIDEYNKIRMELEPMVDAKYPEGIEQASPDMWKAVLEYRVFEGSTAKNIPLPPEEKAKLGLQYGRKDFLIAESVRGNIGNLIENNTLKLIQKEKNHAS